MKRFFLLVGLVLAVMLPAGAGQDYQPKAGETVLKLAVEGRGNVFIRLFTKEAPRTTSRIIELTREGFYNGQKFHRVVRNPRPYLVQIGAPGSRTKSIDDDSLLSEGTGRKVAYEDSGFSNNAEGMVGLSAEPDNRDTGDCQFYITLAPAKFLDGNYTVFGKVVAGMDVVKKIEKSDRLVSATVIGG
ncbi:MAG TPA: peptidylprolyl isomerase [Fimbriimonadaceae bacterium]|nr:peptidylprolyl isomerase [Fimbriimonadaceae bacterium]